jgi:lipoate-protein ligase A
VLPVQCPVADVKKAVIAGFQETFDCSMVTAFLSEAEMARAVHVSKDKYSCDQWNFAR